MRYYSIITNPPSLSDGTSVIKSLFIPCLLAFICFVALSVSPSPLGCFSLLEFKSNCSLMGCTENCAVTPVGPACYCKSGYEISADGKTCKGKPL